ncbi:hypothetical protein V8G54_013437, partial [Vigna mungo]
LSSFHKCPRILINKNPIEIDVIPLCFCFWVDEVESEQLIYQQCKALHYGTWWGKKPGRKDISHCKRKKIICEEKKDFFFKQKGSDDWSNCSVCCTNYVLIVE